MQTGGQMEAISQLSPLDGLYPHFDARCSIHCTAMRQHCPKRNAHDQYLKGGRKKTAFAGRFFCKPQFAAGAWHISRTTLAWTHNIKLCPSMQR